MREPDAAPASHRPTPAAPTATAATEDPLVLDSLTAREKTILSYLALGLSQEAIANRLSVSRRTVEAYTRRLLAKLRAGSGPAPAVNARAADAESVAGQRAAEQSRTGR
ncbi:LuxR C-terminal-related transcriptional regulator [Streptomyces sp. PmtG]